MGSKESLRGLTCLSDLVKDSRSQSFFQAAHQGALPACAQRLSAPKRCLEMLRCLACGLDTPDGEALPPGLHLLSDWQEECQNCLYGRPSLSFPNTAASSGSWDLVLWALEQWTGAGSQGPSPAGRQMLMTLNGTGRELEVDPFCYALCSFLGAKRSSLCEEWYRTAQAQMPALPSLAICGQSTRPLCALVSPSVNKGNSSTYFEG